MNINEIKTAILGGKFDKDFNLLYGETEQTAQRYAKAVDKFNDLFPVSGDIKLFSAPGRTEVSGNHTDHQHGCVLAGSVNLDVIAVVSLNDDSKIRIKSEGFNMDVVDINDLEKNDAENGKAISLEEKPKNPRSNLASMGIYIFSWPVLRDALIALKNQQSCDFGKHIIPYCFENQQRLFAYEFNGYWKDVGTLGSYWEANMELIDLIPEFNLYEEYWKIYTKCDTIEPQYIAGGKVERCIIGESSDIYGEVTNSVIGANVRIGKGSVVRNSIIMKDTVIGENVIIDKSIIAENCKVGDNCHLGVGEEAPNKLNESVYSFGLVTIGEDSVIPEGVSIGKNTAISGVTEKSDYVN